MKMPDSEAKKRWIKENLWTISVKFHRRNDADLVEVLEASADKGKLIKAALREYMKNHPEQGAEKGE